MKKFLLVCGLTALVCLSHDGQAAPAPTIPWEIRGPVDYKFDTGDMVGTQGVVVKYGDRELTANRVRANSKTGQVIAEGVVQLRDGTNFWRGERLEYNFHTKEIKSDEFRAGASPYFVGGFGLDGDQTNRLYNSYYSYFTTDDVETPGYRVRARTIVMVPGEYIEARDAVIYLGKTPVFYWPYYRRNLDRDSNHFEITPGYRTIYGPYLLSSYNWYSSTNLSGAIHLDYRLLRGVGAGPDFSYDLGRWGKGSASFYYLHDDQPEKDSRGIRADADRYRTLFTHQATLRSNLTAKVVFEHQSDETVLREFFEDEYHRNIQPKSFLEVNQFWSNFGLNILAQPQLNTFYDTVERLPDIKLTAARQQLWKTPLYYEGESSVGYYRHQFAYSKTPEFAAMRADTYHQLLAPQTFFGWLNFTPKAGVRLTHYGEDEGTGTLLKEENRAIFNTGAELSMKASRLWKGAESKFFDVDGLRHIVQPSINYVFVPTPNVRPTQLPQFDTEYPSLRLLPIEFPDYNAVDFIDTQNVIRFALWNRLQTKRGGDVQSLVNWALYTDWLLKPEPGQSTFRHIWSDLDFRPRDWLTFTSQLRYDVADGQWQQAYHTLTVQPNNVWSISLGHYYNRNDPGFPPGFGNNLIIGSLYFRLNENWGFRITERFEARDGRLEEQDYTIYRDLRAWTTALTLRLRQDQNRAQDVTIALTISLKAFPRFKTGDDSDHPSLLFGGG